MGDSTSATGSAATTTGLASPTAPTAPGPAVASATTPSGADFYTSALKALNGLFDLHVTTAVGHVKTLGISASDAASAVAELDDPDAKVANTVINTVTGDTTVIYTGDFTSNADLMTIHKEALATAQIIRNETIGLLKKVIEDFADLLNGKLGKTP